MSDPLSFRYKIINNLLTLIPLSVLFDVLMLVVRYFNPLMPGGNKKVTHT